MGFMAGKRALIVGVASDRSIATGIAEAFAREGADIAFTYQNDKLKSRVEKLATRLGQDTELLFPCDVTSDEEIEAVFAGLGKHWDSLDVLVHSVGFAPREQLEGGFTESITREGYAISHDISAYSLAALAKAGGLPLSALPNTRIYGWATGWTHRSQRGESSLVPVKAPANWKSASTISVVSNPATLWLGDVAAHVAVVSKTLPPLRELFPKIRLVGGPTCNSD